MARRVEFQLVDDIDGSDAAETVMFGVDGVDYIIDVNAQNAERLRTDLAAYVLGGRRTSGRRRRRRHRGGDGDGRGRLREVRGWARAQGLTVSDRGRVAKTVQDAYDAAH